MARKTPPWQMDSGEPDGPQRRFLVELKDVYEVLNAGEVGSGKTDAGLMGCVAYAAYRKDPSFKALVLRHQAKDLAAEFYQRVTRPSMYPRYVGGSCNATKGIYTFASGGRVQFTTSKDLRGLQGAEYQYVWVDEATHWPTEDDLLYVITRLRSSTGLPIRLRLGTNPGGPGHAWVKRRFAPWLASDFFAKGADGQDLYPGSARLRELGVLPRKEGPPLASGEVLYYRLLDGGKEQYEPCSGLEEAKEKGYLSRTVLRTKTSDNTALMRADPNYRGRVKAVGSVLFAQLGGDNWDVAEAQGDVFRREWFDIVDAVPPLDGVVRRWDFQYTVGDTKRERAKRDYTTGIKLGWCGPVHNRTWILLHVIRTKGRPDEIRDLVQRTAQMDGRHCKVIVPIDAAAGHWVVSTVTSYLPGYIVVAQREQGEKGIRIQTLAPQVRARRFQLLTGAWVEPFLDEASSFPHCRNDDQLDAVAGAFIHSVEDLSPSMGAIQQATATARAISADLSREEKEDRVW